MRQIDPTESDVRLKAALRKLAAGSPGDASAETGATLARAFRHRHARRRQARMAAVVGLAACLAVSAGLLLKKSPPPTTASTPNATAPAKTTQAAGAQTMAASPTIRIAADNPAPSSKTSLPPKRRPKAAAQSASNLAQPAGNFFALPAYNDTVRLQDMNVVRVEMPGSALRLVGAPVSAGAGERRVLADFVVGQDGTPYAVRLIAVRNTQ